jgi:hypothetical protein
VFQDDGYDNYSVIGYNDTYSSKTLLFYPEDGDAKFLRRVRNLLPDYKASQPEDIILNLANGINIIQKLHVKYHLYLYCITLATYVHKWWVSDDQEKSVKNVLFLPCRTMSGGGICQQYGVLFSDYLHGYGSLRQHVLNIWIGLALYMKYSLL